MSVSATMYLLKMMLIRGSSIQEPTESLVTRVNFLDVGRLFLLI